MEGIHSEHYYGKLTIRPGEKDVYVGIEARQPPYMGDENCFAGNNATFSLKAYAIGIKELRENGECMINNGKDVLCLQATKGKIVLAHLDDQKMCMTYSTKHGAEPIEIPKM